MLITIFAVIFVLIGLGWLAFAPTISIGSDYYGTKRDLNLKPFGLILPVIALLMVVLSSITSVQAKQVGVVTTFGKPSEQTLSSGLHFKAPWQKVTEIDATIQTDEFNKDRCITVILADKNTACVSATIRWAVNAKNANDVYSDFRSDDPTKSLRDAVVSTQFKAALGTVFSTYDAAVTEGQRTQEELSAEAKMVMLTKTKGLVDIDSVTISYIKPSAKVQDKIDALQSQRAKTAIAKEQNETATEEASANKILADSISRDPNVLVSKCLDLLSEGYDAPAGFSCWPGGNGAVVVPGVK